MSSHGPALQVTPSIEREFHSAVIAQLPNLTDAEMQWFNRNKKELGRRFRQVFLHEDAFVRTVYPVTVDYNLSVVEALSSGGYNWDTNNTALEHLFTPRGGIARIVVELIDFDGCVAMEDAPHRLDKMGYRPVEPRELLAFGTKYSDTLGDSNWIIMALHSLTYRTDFLLYFDAEGRRIFRVGDVTQNTYHRHCRFAAVRK